MTFGPMLSVWAASHFEQFMMSAINAAICSVILFIVVCRVRVMTPKTTRKAVRALYAFIALGAFASGGSYWLWDEAAGPGQIAMSMVVLAHMVVWRNNWRHGQPNAAMKG